MTYVTPSNGPRAQDLATAIPLRDMTKRVRLESDRMRRLVPLFSLALFGCAAHGAALDGAELHGPAELPTIPVEPRLTRDCITAPAPSALPTPAPIAAVPSAVPLDPAPAPVPRELQNKQTSRSGFRLASGNLQGKLFMTSEQEHFASQLKKRQIDLFFGQEAKGPNHVRRVDGYMAWTGASIGGNGMCNVVYAREAVFRQNENCHPHVSKFFNCATPAT